LANNAVKTTDFVACTTPTSSDLIILVQNTAGNATTVSCTTNVFFNNTAANVSMNVATFATLAVTSNTTPANNTDTASRPTGSIWADGTYIYFYNGTEIKRSALSTF
jgi:hypothetical protein